MSRSDAVLTMSLVGAIVILQPEDQTHTKSTGILLKRQKP